MRIAILNWKDPADPTAGGAERYVERVAERWAALGHAITLVVPSCPGRPSGEVVHGIEYVRLGSRWTIFPRARAYLRHHGAQFDRVVEAVSTRPFFAHRVVDGRATALYYQIADDVWPQEFPFPVSLLGRHVLEPMWIRGMRGARVIAISPSTRADLCKRGVDVLGIVPPGVDAPAEIPERQPSPSPRLLFVGRLHRTKRPADAIAAAVHIRRALPQARLDVLGSGYLLDELRRTAPDGVVVRGFVSEAEKRRLLAEADLVLVPGTREGWGIVVLEAAAHGVPAVAYDIPGLRDAVVDGVTGLLTERTPEAMAEASIALLSDPERWCAMRLAAHHRALEYSWERAADDLLLALAPAVERSVAAA